MTDVSAAALIAKLLKRDPMRHSNLWFVPDGSMYVYYTPTHWRLPTEAQMEELARNAMIKSEDWKALADRYKHRAALAQDQREVKP